MDKLDELLQNIASYKACSIHGIEESIGRAYIASIVKELLRLGYDEYESVMFEPSKAKARYMGDTVGVCYYLTAKAIAGPADRTSVCEIDGREYALLEDYRTSDGPWNRNRRELQTCHLSALEKIYNFLRLERKSNSLKKK